MQTTPFPHDARIGIMKGGQLGKMLLQAMLSYDFKSVVLDSDPHAPCATLCDDFVLGDALDYEAVLKFGRSVDVLTIEFEHVNLDALETLEKEGRAVHPSSSVLRVIQDKGLQKEFYAKHGLPSSRFFLVDPEQDLNEQIQAAGFSYPVIQKTRMAGYDGKGVKKLSSPTDQPFTEPSLIEECVQIQKELAVLLARNPQGEVAVYPLIEMVFHPEKNLVQTLFAPARVSVDVEEKALALAHKLADELQLVGVLAVELFLTQDGQLLINESAPRVHNSGHHTIEANSTSQFEQHLRAIMGLPLGSTAMHSPAVMVNILGEDAFSGPVQYQGIQELMATPKVHLHLYGKKETRPHRKMGHFTVLDSSLDEALSKADSLNQSFKAISS